jgi:Helix-turn-helix of insertion element transposase
VADNTSQNLPLTPKQKHAINLLLAGESAQRTAATVGVNRRTLYEWRREPDFQEALNHAADEVFGEGRSILRAAFTAAARSISDYAHEGTTDKERCLMALRIVRETVRAWGTEHTIREAEELNERLAALEGASANGHHPEARIYFIDPDTGEQIWRDW